MTLSRDLSLPCRNLGFPEYPGHGQFLVVSLLGVTILNHCQHSVIIFMVSQYNSKVSGEYRRGIELQVVIKTSAEIMETI